MVKLNGAEFHARFNYWMEKMLAFSLIMFFFSLIYFLLGAWGFGLLILFFGIPALLALKDSLKENKNG